VEANGSTAKVTTAPERMASVAYQLHALAIIGRSGAHYYRGCDAACLGDAGAHESDAGSSNN
jgi:hypothetical protein